MDLLSRAIRNFFVIALTGGPCAGKTTILSFLRQKLEDLGYVVLVVPEAATELMQSGITPDRLGREEFNRRITNYILTKEEYYKDVARSLASDKPIIILCDRGALDVRPYTEGHEFDLIVNELGSNLVALRDERYDAAVFMHSVAHDKPEFYTCETNAQRSESVDEARVLDAATLDAWVGHPHLRVIDNSTDLNGKRLRVLQAICRVIGIPEPLEIERKFRLKHFDPTLLPAHAQAIRIEQYYLKGDYRLDEERIRRRGQGGGATFYYKVKRRISKGISSKVEHPISSREYDELLHRADPDLGKIEKTRYCFVYKGQYLELDVLDRPKLVMLECELTDAADEVCLPPELEALAEDVTEDEHYSNYQIAWRMRHPLRS
jgi:CYTH domain-containing protein/predicted ATPase